MPNSKTKWSCVGRTRKLIPSVDSAAVTRLSDTGSPPRQTNSGPASKVFSPPSCEGDPVTKSAPQSTQRVNPSRYSVLQIGQNTCPAPMAQFQHLGTRQGVSQRRKVRQRDPASRRAGLRIRHPVRRDARAAIPAQVSVQQPARRRCRRRGTARRCHASGCAAAIRRAASRECARRTRRWGGRARLHRRSH